MSKHVFKHCAHRESSFSPPLQYTPFFSFMVFFSFTHAAKHSKDIFGERVKAWRHDGLLHCMLGLGEGSKKPPTCLCERKRFVISLLQTGHDVAQPPGKPKKCLYVLCSCIFENLVFVQSILILLVSGICQMLLCYIHFVLKTSRSYANHAVIM